MGTFFTTWKTKNRYSATVMEFPVNHFSELGYERRNGYSWYNQAPESLNEEYQHWKEKYM